AHPARVGVGAEAGAGVVGVLVEADLARARIAAASDGVRKPRRVVGRAAVVVGEEVVDHLPGADRTHRLLVAAGAAVVAHAQVLLVAAGQDVVHVYPLRVDVGLEPDGRGAAAGLDAAA